MWPIERAPTLLRNTIGVAGGFVAGLNPTLVVASLGRRAWIGQLRRRHLAQLLVLVPMASAAIVNRSWDSSVLILLAAMAIAFAVDRCWTAQAYPKTVKTGLVAGSLALVAIVLAEAVLGTQPRAAGPPWMEHPNLAAHAMIAGVIGLATTVTNRHWIRLALLPAGTLAILATGSRSAVLALLFAALVWTLSPRHRTTGLVLATSAVLGLGLVAVVNPGTWDRLVRSTLAVVRPPPAPTNLFFDTEELDSSARWLAQGVFVEPADDGEATPDVRAWSLRRTNPVDWARVQYTRSLSPDQTYVLSGEFLASASTGLPGFLGWARDTSGTSTLRASIDPATGDVVARSSGRIEVLSANGLTVDERWVRLVTVFRVHGDAALTTAIGPTPDPGSDRLGDATIVRGVQLERSSAPSAYEAAFALPPGAGEARARWAIWQAAVRGFGRARLTGNGAGTFAAFLSADASSDGATAQTPAHAHNVVLEVLYTSGLLGLTTLIAVFVLAVRMADAWSLAILLGLLVANGVDATLLTSQVAFPIAATIGIASARRRERHRDVR